MDALRENSAVSSFDNDFVGADQRMILRRSVLKGHALKHATGIGKIRSAKIPNRDLTVTRFPQIL
jgi:hypothetical protein